MERKITFAPGEFYHLYSRGADKSEIFRESYDYERFIKFLYLANNTSPIKLRQTPPDAFTYKRDGTLVDIGAYCLMPNHFHLLIKEHTEGGVSTFMSKLLTSHSSFFNKKYKRTGTLFEGRFKAKHANDDNYLKYLFAYTHLNPVKLIQSNWKEKGIANGDATKAYLEKYRYSSYQEYTTDRERRETKILNRPAFPEYFTTATDFTSMIRYWLDYKNLDL